MKATDAIRTAIDNAKMISMGYLDDLSDEEMMHRPHPKCNHIKWQLGHLIFSEHQMIAACIPEAMPPLPDGFAEKYTRETSSIDDPTFFHTKAELLSAFEEQRNGTLKALAQLAEEDLDRKSPEEMQQYAPNWGAAFIMQNVHWMMHAGQWSVIRRQLGRDPLF